MEKEFGRRILLLFFVSLLFGYGLSARIGPVEGVRNVREGSLTEISKDLFDLMGTEECGDRDEECMKRRMITEAHLDYIYTQHLKP